MTNKTLSDDVVRQFGFNYVYDGKTNILICSQCNQLFKELQAELKSSTKTTVYNFFNDYGKDKDNGNNRGHKNG